jgi:hypothetical protein
MKLAFVSTVSLVSMFLVSNAWADDLLFSGPQPGEPLPGFVVRKMFSEDAGKDVDFVAQANGEPIVLIFVHDVNRQSISMTRILSDYTASRVKDRLHTGVVWLRDDATEAELELNRIRHALAPNAPVGISVDGGEGPGSYGLNRNVTLTILLGTEGKVTANFALIQPSLQVDLPKVLDSVIELVGGTKPTLDQLPGMPAMLQRSDVAADLPNLRPLLQPLISKTATIEDVDAAAREIESRIHEDPASKRELGRIANTIINAGKLANYGTPQAQKYLAKWADEIKAP